VGHDTSGTKGFMLISARDEEQAFALVGSEPLLESGYYADIAVTSIAAPYPLRT
jgi:uncharacterized protein YciI